MRHSGHLGASGRPGPAPVPAPAPESAAGAAVDEVEEEEEGGSGDGGWELGSGGSGGAAPVICEADTSPSPALLSATNLAHASLVPATAPVISSLSRINMPNDPNNGMS